MYSVLINAAVKESEPLPGLQPYHFFIFFLPFTAFYAHLHVHIFLVTDTIPV